MASRQNKHYSDQGRSDPEQRCKCQWTGTSKARKRCPTCDGPRGGSHETPGKRKETGHEKTKAKGVEMCRGRNKGSMTCKDESTAGASTSREDDELEIPGFYYDREKKKYFRILPGHNNPRGSTTSSLVTEDVVKLKVEEQQKEKYLKLREEQRKSDLLQTIKKREKSVNLVTLLDEMRTGLSSDVHFQRSVLTSSMSNLKYCGKQKITHQPLMSQYASFDSIVSMVPNYERDKLLCVWSSRYSMTMRIQSLKIDINPKVTKMASPCTVTPTGASIQSSAKVTSACWAPLSRENNNDNHNNQCRILYTTIGHLNMDHPSLALFKDLEFTSVEERARFVDFNLGFKALWCCAWCQYTKRFSVGSEKCGLLVDVETRKLWELHSKNNDILSQTFTENGTLLYSGTKNPGCVLCHDLRSISTRYVYSLPQGKGVCCLKLLKDENYLLAGNFPGKLALWDLRKRRVVHEYPRHKNQYFRLQFSVDDRENFICAVGSDSISRIWSLSDAKLLHELPPLCQTDNTGLTPPLPQLCFSENWAKNTSFPALLMGLKNKMHFYSLY
ncbi:DDB1- and CUL4-associated factor 4-like [Lingula anatina]|uniref:DDB1- and CUL4-associated factor 4-like n=1 Tax=Lingula anatina TaxID=7574 RepID=A0A2R2MPI4_LINAN|nr:DDB1- and CUL4-associated factor 4-like [Lingula anatina]|eukprot:XP_023932145.1 DDB1- and CUL4-associated factor 4-like [Lingula anatina]